MNQHQERAHAIVAPSSFKRVMECPGSIALSKDIIPGKPSEYAAEGTRFHEWIEKLTPLYLRIDDNGNDGADIDEFKSLCDELAEENEEMYEHAINYCSFVYECRERFIKAYPGTLTLLFERRVKLYEHNWGTLDLGLISVGEHGVAVCINDAKYGRGVEVGVEGNVQLINYLLALQKEINNQIDVAHLFVYQPRTPGKAFSQWRMDRATITEWEEKIRKGYDLAVYLHDNPDKLLDSHFSPGDHCRFCPALKGDINHGPCKYHLSADRDSSMQLLNDDLLPSCHVLTLQQQIDIHKRKKTIEQFLDANEAALTARLENGAEVPGFKLTKSNTKRTWDKTQTEKKIGTQLKKLGIKEPFREKLITIGDAERELKKVNAKAKTPKTLEGLAIKPEGRNQIVPESDGREAIDGSTVKMLDELT